MSSEQTMHNGLPVKYWVFRSVVSLIQILLVIGLIAAATIWALSDGNGVRLWDDYYSFSQNTYEWARYTLRLPWE